MKPGSKLDRIVSAIVFNAGVAAIGYGLWLVYPPATWIFGGLYATFVTVGYQSFRGKVAKPGAQ